MASPAAISRRIHQKKINLTSLPLYYEGNLWIRQATRKECKYWTELRGTKLFLYTDKLQEKSIDNIDLQSLVSVTNGCPQQKQSAELILRLAKEEIYLKTETPEDIEEWKGFILTVVELSIPNYVSLLPGQILQLKETLEKEKVRRKNEQNTDASSSSAQIDETYEDASRMPECFQEVTRQEATNILNKMSEFGNLILRPGTNSNSFAVSIKEPLQTPSDRPQIKHYRILSTGTGYTIELEDPVNVNSLDEVVNFFVTETRGKLIPLLKHVYDRELGKGSL
ncbi:signal-transducing adaptor protein 1 [Xenopus laevis]|uniref:Signal-transducing adaptor protein 1 n=2 Tax=Xenopus laevis TaxID=8355 RepID=A0A1L8HVK5_XENLA|nr:signal-transducing adaptor protein 1 [Xenopus laevis]XP_041447070.1 signal-transducing adaptor protein 1 [Xenopus laevis]XP_041447071.1 signal-transducing adaptor protein 1 [Xenopus laevis]XP_041447072.1 signal-transducing adaptor protein 1 [Xenopus laevis]XP_041447074.1 signal-transducing adaptor protein 1 [Xenopus laevis]OCU00114.1 hypothetical protein XELAEV_18005900mg [Xenopus laevis]